MMKFKTKSLSSSGIYQKLFVLVLLVQHSVSGQIDWAEDDDDPGILSRLENFSYFFPL
jgi:hypothetical protein